MTQAAGPPGWGLTTVHAAGSLRHAFTALGARFDRDHGQALRFCFGAAGLLKERLAAGEVSSLFASANLAHPQALVNAGLASAVQPFASNRLCLLVTPDFAVRGQGLAARLLDTDLRVGTSTVGADPSGDYAWQLFDRIEVLGDAPRGAAAALKAKALQLTGGGERSAPSDGRSLYGSLLMQGAADVFLTYRTNALQACKDFAELRLWELPAPWAVPNPYGLALLEPAPAGGQAFASLLLSAQGRAVLRAHGFQTP